MGCYKTYHGKYDLKRPDKYIGSQAPIYRSSWEAQAFRFCEMNANVLKWGSEIIKIPYCWPDGSVHKYIPDLYIEMLVDKTIKRFIVEIKPHGQGPFANRAGEVKIPQRPKNNNPRALKRYITEMITYKKNESKWIAAQAYCNANNMQFIILSDEDFTL